MIAAFFAVCVASSGEVAATGRPVTVSAVSVNAGDSEVAVVVSVLGGPATHRTTFLHAPPRIVVDVEEATFAWSESPLRSLPAPIAEIRGSQWTPAVARVVVELARPVPYQVDATADGLVVILPLPRPPDAAGSPPGSAHDVAQPRASDVGAGQEAGAAAAPSAATNRSWSVRGHVEAGARFYLNDRGRGLEDDSIPLHAIVDLQYRLTGETQLRLRPQLAIDPLISSRNRYEPLDAYVEHSTSRWALLVGQAVENWAITDTFNPVDVINRLDLERDFYDPERLGEVMLRLRYFLPEAAGFEQPTVSLYLLPLHRETPLPSNRDRFRLDATGDNRGDLREDDAIVASPDVAYAARLSATLGQADVFLFYFGGPSRIPSLQVSPFGEVTPVYYLVDMVGGGVQWARGPWVFKLEAAQTFTRTSGLRAGARRTVPDAYFQYVVGGDRTFTDVLGNNEVTVTLEYAGEDRMHETALTGLRPYKSDVFLGVRWAFNDVRRTELQGSVVTDVLVDEQLWLLTFSTALYGDLRLVVGGQFVNRAPANGRDRFTAFNVFPNNSNAWAALRYGF